MKITVKHGASLTENEINEINKALDREFTISSEPREFLRNRLFFLLKDKMEIVSFCSLVEVKPVYLNKKEFSLMGIVHVVANSKAKGYGKKVVTAMKNYLESKRLTAIGFTHIKNKGFYEKCGFIFPPISTKRIVTQRGETNEDGQIIFCIDGADHFIETVLSNPNEVVTIPKENLW